MKNENKGPIFLTLIAFITHSVSLTAMGAETIYFPNEASPEDIAAEFAEELGMEAPAEAAEVAPRDRIVQPADFGKYRLTVDIFRSSAKRPVLGPWSDDYLESTNATFTAKNEKTRLTQGKKRYLTLAGGVSNKKKVAGVEFAVISIDSVPVKAYIISGAREAEVNLPVMENGHEKKEIARDPVTGEVIMDPVTGRPVIRKVMKLSKKTTPNGNFKISPKPVWKVPFGSPRRTAKVLMPDPWPLSSAYELSTMYWGLQIFGGYLIHSTPHYGELGKPASMGCIRQPYPEAMELFDMVVNQFGGTGMIRIHKGGSDGAYTRLRELFYDPNYLPAPELLLSSATASAPRDMKWLVERLNINYTNVKDFVKFNQSGEYELFGHTWLNPATKRPDAPVYPRCGGYDCFTEFGDPMEMRSKRVMKKREADSKKAQEQEQRLLEEVGYAPVLE